MARLRMETTWAVLGQRRRYVNWNRSLTQSSNPYEPPTADAPREPDIERATRLPDTFVKPTRYALRLLAILSVALPLILSPIVDGFRINPFSIVPLTVGFTIGNRSFTSFPWTALACLSFVLGFLGDCSEHEVMDIWNWFPARSSPLLAVRLLCAAVGVYTGWMVWRCHRYHKHGQVS